MGLRIIAVAPALSRSRRLHIDRGKVMVIRQGRRDITPEQLDKLVATFAYGKAEDDEEIDSDDIFVKTEAFSELAARNRRWVSTVILGRKGDGKTALLRRLKRDMQRHNENSGDDGEIEIYHLIEMQETFFVALMFQFDEIAAHITRQYPGIPIDQIAAKMWLKYIQLAAIQIAIHSIRDRPLRHTHAIEGAELQRIEQDIEREIGAESRQGTGDISSGFLSMLSAIVDKFRTADTAIARDVGEPKLSQFDRVSVLRDLDSRFVGVAKQILDSGRRVTIAIDRFDDYIDHMVSSGQMSTPQSRRNFLHGMITALTELHRRREYRWLRVVASLPEDLIQDMNLREIAAHRSLLFLQIKWSARDLIKIMNNRIAKILPDSRWDDLFTSQVQNTNKNVQKKEECAEYIVRHTTRRPREVMRHAHALFERMQMQGDSLSTEVISEIVAATNRWIVDQQIIPEWRTVVPELEHYVQRMGRVRPATVFSFQEFSKWSAAMVLLYAYYDAADVIDEEWRYFLALAILYRIGVVGFRVRQVESGPEYISQGDGDYARYLFSHCANTDPIADVTSQLLNPELRKMLDKNVVKSVKGFLASGRDEDYSIKLCFAPVFFESLHVQHGERYVVDEVVPDQGVY